MAIGGVWYPVPYSQDAAHGKDIILHLHGGAYVLLGSREQDCGFGSRNMSREFNDALVFCPQYRLSTSENSYFPAALQDAVTAYRYLLDTLKVPASKIILSGDSAGGNLALALLRYIQETAALPLPKAAMLWSPWVNLSDATDVDQSKNRDTDFLIPELTTWGVKALTNSYEIPVSSPYISPLQAPFQAEIPLWVTVGAMEVLHESVNLFVDAMEEVGAHIRLYTVEGAPHDIFAGGGVLGFEKEAVAAVTDAKEFIKP